MYRKEQTVAPKERINIVYKPAIEGAEEMVELPLRQLVIGEFISGLAEDTLAERKPISIDKDNFDTIFKEREIALTLEVADKLSDNSDKKVSVNLKFEHLRDFEPDSIIDQIPELKKLIEIRNKLKALKGPLGNVPAFRKKLNEIVVDKSSREKLVKELSESDKKD